MKLVSKIRQKLKVLTLRIAKNALIPLILWLSAAGLSFLALAVILGIGAYVFYPPSELGQMAASVLAVAGFVVAVLFAVFNSINAQSREKRYSGFQ